MSVYWFRGLLAAVVLCLPAGLRSGFAQDDLEPRGAEYPLQLVQIAGIDRLQEKADALFLAAERPEMSDFVASWLQTSLKELKGWDRTRPFGMMFYLKPGLVPGIATISFIPVSNIDELLQTLAGPEGQIHELGVNSGRYELLGVAWGPSEVAVRQIGNYLFVTENSDAVELDRQFPSPERLVNRLSARYDASYSLLLKNLPPATKKLFMEFFKNSALAGLQQRDDEPEAAYRIRRANGESLLDFLDKVVNQGEEITLGAMIDADKQTGAIELDISGTRDSGLAKFFQDTAGRRSYFTPVLDEAATFTMSMSWQLDPKQRKVFTELFTLAPEMIDEENRKSGGTGGALTAFQPLFRAFLATAEGGHLDMFMQLSGTEPLDYRMLAGFRVLGGSSFPDAVTSALQFVKTFQPTSGPPLPKFLTDIKIGEETLEGHPVHVVPLPAPPDRYGRSMFGDAPNLYIHATPQALWLAFGNESARDQLRDYLDQIANPRSDAPAATAAPFVLTTRGHQWVNTQLAAGDDPEQSPGLANLQQAFSPDNDRLTITSRPTDNGARTRIEAEAGFIAWIGRMVAGQIDRGLERQANPRPQRQRTDAPRNRDRRN